MSIKKLVVKIDNILFRPVVNLLYKEYYRPKTGYKLNYRILLRFAIAQKLFRINGSAPWPVHFTSLVLGDKNIKKGFMCDPGDSIGCYIQAYGGIEFGSNVEIGPGVKIISQNHDLNDFSTAMPSKKPIIIGDNVRIGANSVILPEVTIGSNVVIGAGSVVTKDIPSNSIAVGNPCQVIRKKEPYDIDIYKIKLNREYRK
jgi:acetyltransferase-like isoleucine patch superfamily enzyme